MVVKDGEKEWYWRIERRMEMRSKGRLGQKKGSVGEGVVCSVGQREGRVLQDGDEK